ncbi:MAG: glycoside hydrolase [Bacteroidetes bacterium]|nr:glycoside hydrolase [Bacteroidota bacterium]MCH8524298.1 glycosyl hydrolase-related protein [Balneolales bacterium]
MPETQHQQKIGIVVSHTHWDRAWYLTFQQFRHRMVRMIDRLIPLLQQNQHYHSFTLDGQTILLDDYLEIKPYNKTILRQLISTGKLIVGPWYILPDLFLVSGESVIRNLQIGLSTARSYGSSMQEGYVPDPFGHFAQLPQVLNQFGIRSFIFMRGLDADSKEKAGSIFEWESPNGSSVLTTYLVDGYFNGAALGYPDQYGRFDGLKPDVELASKRINEAIEKLQLLQKEHVFLINNGFDHMPEQPELPEILAHINRNGTKIDFRHGTFNDFFEAVRAEGHSHEIIRGDLLGNADHPILSSVFSTRIYLKQQNHRSQSLLEKHIEPLALWTRFNTGRPDVSDFLTYGWKLLLQNHPHDDICGCSTDGVHEDDEVRFRQVQELAESLMVEQLEAMMKTGIRKPATTGLQSSDVFVYNPNPFPVTQYVTTSVLFANAKAEQGDRTPERVLSGCDANGNTVAVKTLSSNEHSIRNNFLETSWGRRYHIAFEVEVPPGGYHIVHIFEKDEPAQPVKKGSAPFEIQRNKTTLKASETSYEVHFAATGKKYSDFVLFEFEHDNGDTYTFGPVPEKGIQRARLTAVKPVPENETQIELTHNLTIARSLQDETPVVIDIKTTLELQHNGSVSVQVNYTNHSEDSRLRVILPAGLQSQTAAADGHFRLAERQTVAYHTPESNPDRYKSYPGELEYRTQHMNDFILLDDEHTRYWLAGRGLHEFELLQDEDQTLVAVTINRSVGLLSTGNGRIRRVQAGPAIAVPGAQCLREIRAELSFGCVLSGQKEEAIKQARSFSHPLWVREMPYLPHLKSGEQLPRSASIIEIEHPEIALSSFRLHPDGDTAVLRVYNLSDQQVETTVRCNLPVSKWSETDLYERWNDADIRDCITPGVINLHLSPHEIKTIVLRTRETV